MSLHHLFCNNPALAKESDRTFVVDFDAQDRAHVRALRLNAGEHIALVDALQDYFEVEIVSVDGDRVEAKIAQHLDAAASPLPLNLVQGLAKGEKMDTVLRAATELGIDSFYPATMNRSVVHLDAKKVKKRHERFSAIARSAALQSGRTSIPKAHLPSSLDEIANSWNEHDMVLVFWEDARADQTVNRLFSAFEEQSLQETCERLWVVVGPEGGIAEQEVALMQESLACVHLLTLGPTILRTETAGIVATALVQNELRNLFEGRQR